MRRRQPAPIERDADLAASRLATRGAGATPCAFDPTADIDYDACIDHVAAGIVGTGSARMASITIRNIEDSVKAELRVRAARHGRSMEEEARQILRLALSDEAVRANLADLAEALFGSEGLKLEPHPPVPTREPPDFGR
jgi:antitoxin FitA